MVHTTEYYDFLGVSEGASDDDIKKAYRRLALKHHPDKNGDPEQFKRLADVYEVLKDPQKRRAYDQHGPDAVEGAGGGRQQARPGFSGGFPPGFSVEEVFGSMFGGFQQSRPSADGGAAKKRAGAIKHTVLLSMEDVYRGKTLRIAVQRAIICPRCGGDGGKDVSERPCVPCGGRGFATLSRASIFQSLVRCQACDATGKIKTVGDPCRACKSTGMGTERIVLEPVVKPGDRPKMTFIFRGKGDCVKNAKNAVPGDVVITTVQQPSPSFTRRGQDLHTNTHISLKDCLSGFTANVKHLDGRLIEIGVPKGKVTPPGTVIAVKNEGIPANKGTLFVTVQVKFPPHFSDASIDMLDILPELSA